MTRAIKTMRCTLTPNAGIRATSCIRDAHTTTTMRGILEAWIYNGKCIKCTGAYSCDGRQQRRSHLKLGALHVTGSPSNWRRYGRVLIHALN